MYFVIRNIHEYKLIVMYSLQERGLSLTLKAQIMRTRCVECTETMEI